MCPQGRAEMYQSYENPSDHTGNIGRFHPFFIDHEGPQEEQRYSSTLFLTSALEGGEGSASRPGRTLPPGRPGTHCIGGWVGLRAGLDRCGKSRPHRDSIPGPSSPQAVAILTTLPGPHTGNIALAFLPGKVPNVAQSTATVGTVRVLSWT